MCVDIIALHKAAAVLELPVLANFGCLSTLTADKLALDVSAPLLQPHSDLSLASRGPQSDAVDVY